MESSDSPQLYDVGEDLQNLSEKRLISGNKPSYASLLVGKHSAEKETKLELCPVLVQNGTPTVEFTVDEVNSFTREEGLHQAVIIKFSYGKPAIHELRQMLPRYFDIKGKCNIGLLEHRHILVRFDLLEDFVKVVSRASGYVRYKGDDFFYRTFPWTMRFNPREETSKVVVWISFPDLPANFFARKSLMSIASTVGKPLVVDKATNEHTRPSTARVKVLVNLIDKHPKKVKSKVVDMKSGNLVEYDQKIVFDNLPKYCTYCLHQGHEKKVCRWISEDCNDKTVTSNVSESKGSMPISGRDAREILNEIKADRRGEVIQLSGNKDVAKKNADDAKDKFAEAVQFCKDSNSVNVQQIANVLPKLPLAVTPAVIQQNSANDGTSIQQQAGLINCDKLVSAYAKSTEVLIDHSPGQNVVASIEQFPGTGVESADELALPNGIPISNAYVDSLDKTGSKLSAEVNSTQAAEKLTPPNFCFVSDHTGSSQDSLQTNLQIQPKVSDQSKKEYAENDISERSANKKQKLCVLPSSKQSTIPSVEAKSSTQKGHQVKDMDKGVLDQLNPVRSDADNMDTVDQNSHISRIKINEFDPTVLEMTVAANEICPTINDASGRAKLIRNTVSLNSISMMDFQLSRANSTFEIVSVSGVKNPFAQQNIELDKDMVLTNQLQTSQSSKINSKAEDHIMKERPVVGSDETENTPEMQQTVSVKATTKVDKKVGSNSKQKLVAGTDVKVISAKTVLEGQQKKCDDATKHITSFPEKNNSEHSSQIKGSKIDPLRKEVASGRKGDAAQYIEVLETANKPATANDYKTEDFPVHSQLGSKKSSDQNSKSVTISRKQIAYSKTVLMLLPGSNGNKTEGKIQSYPAVPYSFVEQEDHTEFSIFKEENNQQILANTRDLVIKSKLWDQRHFDNDEDWDEDSNVSSSTEEDQFDSLKEVLESQTEPAMVTWRAETQNIEDLNSGAKPKRFLNRNAPVYIPKSKATDSSSMVTTVDLDPKDTTRLGIQRSDGNFNKHLQKDMEETFEEGEEDEIVSQCRKDATRKGDVSPLHSKLIKKGHHKDRSCDGRAEVAITRRPPMRLAKQKYTQRSVNKK